MTQAITLEKLIQNATDPRNSLRARLRAMTAVASTLRQQLIKAEDYIAAVQRERDQYSALLDCIQVFQLDVASLENDFAILRGEEVIGRGETVRDALFAAADRLEQEAKNADNANTEDARDDGQGSTAGIQEALADSQLQADAVADE